jgi:hypothetical protein
MTNSEKIKVFLPTIILTVILLFLFVWRLRVSATRFFDVDEFTHMHWAAQMARGEKPYLDFFTFFPPGYYWFLRPLFWFYSGSADIFLAGRKLSFFVFLGILSALAFLFAKMRSKKYVLLPVVLLTFLPMPFDKYLEIRPDNFATFLGLVGVCASIVALDSSRKKISVLFWGIAGVCYSASVLVLTKMMPFATIGGGIAGLSILLSFWEHKKIQKTFLPAYGCFLGMGIVGIFFLLWIVLFNNISAAWYSLLKLPFEANTINRFLIMEPHLFFFPNSSFYGGTGTGITKGLFWNHTIWLLGIVFGAYRLFTPFLAGKGEKNKILRELLVAGIWGFSVWGYIYGFPLKHSQYLIPIAIFIAFYAADGIVLVLEKLEKKHILFSLVLLIGIGVALIPANQDVNAVKLSWTNENQLKELTQLIQTIPQTQDVFDLEGRMVFWKTPYAICCLSYGIFFDYISQKPLPLSQVLEEKKTPYVFQGDSGRFWAIPSGDVTYIKEHYAPVPDWGEKLWKRK